MARSVMAGAGYEAHDHAATVCEQFGSPYALTRIHIADFAREANPLERSGRVRRSSILVRHLLCSAHSAGCWGGGSGRAAGGREGGWELLAGGDRELLVGVGEVPFDGPGGDEQVLGDLAVGQTVGGELGDAALAGCQRVEPAEDEPSGSPAGGDEFGAGPLGQH